MDQLPALQLVCALGAGYEKVDVAHARTRGIATGNGAGTNDSCVADHTLALVLASVRQLDYYGAQLRAGVWRTTLPLPAGITGKRLGVLGLGTIGRKIALRAQAFEMEVGYHNRSPKADAPWTYFDSCWRWRNGPMCWSWPRPAAPDPAPGGCHRDARSGPARPPGQHRPRQRGGYPGPGHGARSGELGFAALDVYESEPLAPRICWICPMCC
jgi:lactate dehydrogenase-like 2-hydroxyacid dehydrogenase